MTESNKFMRQGEQFNPYRLFVGSFIPNALMKFKGLSSTAKLVYARLAQFAGEKGECYPSVEKLAEEVGIHKRQCVSVLAELEKNKFVKIVRPEGKDKMLHRTNRYFFLWHTVFDCTSGGAVDCTSGGAVDCTSGGAVDCTSGGAVDCTSGGAVDCTQRESVLKESFKENHLKKSSSSLKTETNIATNNTINDDDDFYKNIYKKFKEYPEDRINKALSIMEQIEKSKEIKNRTAYLSQMLKNGFEDIIPDIPKKNKSLPVKYKPSINDRFYAAGADRVINTDTGEHYGPPPIKINADDEFVSVGDVIQNFFKNKEKV